MNGPGTASEERDTLLTVDDDPAVSRAIARDLRRRYGDRHRILRAGSAGEALEALKDLKLRGARLAVVLADYRMPEMSGIEFLEQAMDIFPRARRALLTAYADTDAAIAAINVVDVDHYLLKPWDPPEEKLYPVVDSMLAAYRAEPDAATRAVKVVGHRWSPPSFQVRDFLARNAIPYRWYQADEPEAARLLQAADLPEGTPLPVVVTTEGEALVAPSIPEVARAVGLSTNPATDLYDLVVVGAGPAGLGAAVYGASEGLRTLLIERDATGGQAGQSSRIENYLGFPDGVSGGQLMERARRQAVRFGAEILTTCDVTALRAAGPARVVEFDDGREVTAHVVVVATGVSYRELDAPGVHELTGRGVYYGSAMTEGPECAGSDVYIVGGANSAGQAAVFFAAHARTVTLVVRGESLDSSMSHYLIGQLGTLGNVEVRTGTVVTEAHGADRLEALTLVGPDGTAEKVPTSHVFVFIGAQPHTDWLDGVLDRDESGFLRTGTSLVVDGHRPPGWPLDRDPWPLESSVPGVFVAGDVRAESVKRVASAVGDGAMAVSLAHRFLGAS